MRRSPPPSPSLRPRNKRTQPRHARRHHPSPLERTTASAKPAKKQKGQPTPVPTSAPLSATTAHSPAEICAATVLKRKRAKYAYVRPPPTLAQELAVMQFAEGGSMEGERAPRDGAPGQARRGRGRPCGRRRCVPRRRGGHLVGRGRGARIRASPRRRTPASGPIPAPAWEAFDLEPTTAPPAIESRPHVALLVRLRPRPRAPSLPLPEHEDRAHALPRRPRARVAPHRAALRSAPVLCLPARPPAPPAPHPRACALPAADVDMAAAFGPSGTENTQPATPPAGPRRARQGAPASAPTQPLRPAASGGARMPGFLPLCLLR